MAAPISFGKPSQAVGSKSGNSSTSVLSSLLGKKQSGVASKLLGGGLLSFGLNSLFSSFEDMFGSSKPESLPALQRFSLPDSRDETRYVNSQGISSENMGGQARQSSSPVYNSVSTSQQQKAIVDAVKSALLTSSSLNDVIGEL